MKANLLIILCLLLSAGLSAKPLPKTTAKKNSLDEEPKIEATSTQPASTSESKSSSRAENRFGVGVWLGGPSGVYGAWLAYYILPIIDIEVGGTYYPGFSHLGFHGGLKWHFLGGSPGQRWSPYIGIMVQYISYTPDIKIATSSSGSTVRGSGSGMGLYIPFGFELVAYNGFNLAIEGAYDYLPKIAAEANYNGTTLASEFGGIQGFWAGIKLGYRF